MGDNARRTFAQIKFQGADITNDIRPFLLSMSYTDNEEDETDDLQITLQDRDELWMKSWLGAAIEASGTEVAVQNSAPALKIGEIVQFLGGPHYSNANASTYPNKPKAGPAKITNIYSKGKHPYHLIHTDHQSSVYGWVDTNLIAGADAENVSSVKEGFSIQAVIAKDGWGTNDAVLDCGMFELDSISCSGPPAVVTIKASSLPYTSTIRQTKKTKAWEEYKLSGIVKEMASKNNMNYMFLSEADPEYERVEQYDKSDIAFLSDLCHKAGLSLKATNNIIVVFDQKSYEAKASAITIKKGDHSYMKWKLRSGSADTQYDSCRVSYTTPKGKKIQGVAKVADYNAKSKNNQQLEITAKVDSVAEAKALAEKYLRLHNKYEKTASFTLPGNANLVAGVTVTLEGFGAWNGKFIISRAVHSISGSGYTTEITLRSVLGGY